ncbi:hypothetical protein [Micromonospora trifolii]|uniref:hypothetical protein n=1 Tax=Micromonospora trifolii TaxID=2911208 RepID=UPI003CFB2F98
MTLVTAVAGILLLPACDSPEPPSVVTAGEMAGTWCSGQKDRLLVSDSGEFEVNDLSRDYFSVLRDDDGEYTKEFVLKRDFGAQVPTTGHGRWTFKETSTSPRLYLEFKALGSFLEPIPSELIIRRDEHGALGLYGYEGDPDVGYLVRFVRCS